MIKTLIRNNKNIITHKRAGRVNVGIEENRIYCLHRINYDVKSSTVWTQVTCKKCLKLKEAPYFTI